MVSNTYITWFGRIKKKKIKKIKKKKKKKYSQKIIPLKKNLKFF